MKHPTILIKNDYLKMPGLASVHSHAFQRAMRGLTQRKSQQTGSFWSWRGLMYQLANRLDPDSIYAVARMAYAELALSGVTMVGEFHYVHHQPDGTPYANRTELADAVIRAATDVGIRICLIRTAYMRAGYRQEVAAGQRRFIDGSTDDVLGDFQQLQRRHHNNPLVSIALAAHSVRAVPLEHIVALCEYADEGELPFHMHVCEQRRELEECVAEHGVTPIELLNKWAILTERFVGVHATHLESAEIQHLGQNNCFINLCRTTERDLGDGLPQVSELVAAGARLCVGVDSHCGENAFEEVRAIELDERSRLEARTVVGNAALLLDAGTRQGYHACGLGDAWQQDYVLLDRDDPALVGLPASHVTDGVVFNATPRAVRAVTVNGRAIVQDAQVADYGLIVEEYKRALRMLLL